MNAIADILGEVGIPAPLSELASRDWDVVVVGGGHNGLACAAYLARAGKTVLVLERRERLAGGSAQGPGTPGWASLRPGPSWRSCSTTTRHLSMFCSRPRLRRCWTTTSQISVLRMRCSVKASSEPTLGRGTGARPR